MEIYNRFSSGTNFQSLCLNRFLKFIIEPTMLGKKINIWVYTVQVFAVQVFLNSFHREFVQQVLRSRQGNTECNILIFLYWRAPVHSSIPLPLKNCPEICLFYFI